MNDTIENSSLESKLEQAHRELNMLYEVSAAMRSTLDLEHILYIILTGVTSHAGLGYNRAILFLVNHKTRCLECEMVIGPESHEHATKIWSFIESSQPKLDDLINREKVESTLAHSALLKKLKEIPFPLNSEASLLLIDAFRKGAPWHVSRETLNHYSHDPLLMNFHTKDLMIMPLRAKGNINGLIVADNFYTQKPINGDDIRIFSMLAGQAGLAIENSRLYELTVEKAHTDALTNLRNHGFFQEQLSHEIQTAQKTHQSLSLLMIDIDHFKALNDTYGHQNGDAILKELGNLLAAQSRDSDHICRYGGEEFAIILRQTAKEQSFEIAERLRKTIEQHTFKLPLSGQSIQLTVSLGCATFPQDAQGKEDLITNADQAMYIAKFSGRNKTCLAAAQNSSNSK